MTIKEKLVLIGEIERRNTDRLWKAGLLRQLDTKPKR